MLMGLVWGALAGGLAMFIWNAIAWMALPHHHGDFKTLGKSSPVEGSLAGVAPGLYMYPHYKDYPGGMKDPEFVKMMESSPKAWFVVMKQKCSGMSPGVFLGGFAINVVEALGLSILLYLAGTHTGGLVRAVAFSAGVGGLARFGSYASQTVWMQLPRRYAMTNLFDGVMGFALAGLVIHFLR